MKIQKVDWRNGDIITEEHIRQLEAYFEELNAQMALLASEHGLFRALADEPGFNQMGNIEITGARTGAVFVSVDNLKGITPEGKLIIVDAPEKKELQTTGTRRDDDQYFYVTIFPDQTQSQDVEDNLSDMPNLYSPGFTIELKKAGQTGICLARFKEDAGTIKVDRSFIPFSIKLNSSQHLENAHIKIVKHLRSLSLSLEKYLDLLGQLNGKHKYVAISQQLYRLFTSHLSLLEETSQSFAGFLRQLKQFFSSCYCEIEIFKKLNQDLNHSEIEKIDQSLETLNALILIEWPAITSGQGIDVSSIFICLNTLEQLMIGFPRFESNDLLLQIGSANFTQNVAGFNRIEIELAEGIDVGTEDTLHLEFNEFLRTKSHFQKLDYPELNFRISAQQNADYNKLLDKKGYLRQQKNKQNGFVIDYPVSILKIDHLKFLKLYLPPPIGEDVENHQEKIQIHLQKSAAGM